MRILFVCTGNTCRSPMAEGLFNDKVKRLGLPHIGESAGTGAFDGMGANENSIEALKELGIDISSHRARRASEELVRDFDLVVCMESAHVGRLWQMGFTGQYKVLDVDDPYGSSLDSYIRCRDEINTKLDRLIEELS